MASSATTAGFVLLDLLLRRLALPLVLVTGVLVRYNVFSLVYLLLFMVGLVIPGPQLKNHKAASVVYLVVLSVVSLLFALAQIGFQISIATGLKLVPCEDILELTLRQIGLIQYKDVPAVDIVRFLLPDVVIFAVSAVALGITIKVATLGSTQTDDDGEAPPTATATIGTTSTESTTLSSSSTTIPCSSECGQEYLRIPKPFLYIIKFFIFTLLWVCGMAFTSITSLAYFAFFLFLLLLWSVHLRCSSLVRWLRVITLIYTAVHVVVLYLYQFQSAQQLLPYQPYNTTERLIARWVPCYNKKKVNELLKKFQSGTHRYQHIKKKRKNRHTH